MYIHTYKVHTSIPGATISKVQNLDYLEPDLDYLEPDLNYLEPWLSVKLTKRTNMYA